MVGDRKRHERALILEMRKERILEEAEILFLTQGLHNTTITHIAQSCEMARGALYNYFGSKDEIAFIIWTKISRGFLEVLTEAVTGTATGMEGCSAVLHAYLRTMADHRKYHALDAQLNAYFAKRYPVTTLVEEFFRVNAEIAGLVERELARGVKDGSVRPLEDTGTTALVLLNAMNSFAEKYALREELMDREQPVPLARQFPHLVELLVSSLEAP